MPDPNPNPAPNPNPNPAPNPAPNPDPNPNPAPATTIVNPNPNPNPNPDPNPSPKGDWPDNWRDLIAGGDKTFRQQLDRMGSPLDVGKSWRELTVKQSSGALKSALPENATPEQKAAWRAENGLPDKPEAYVEKLELPNGMAIGEADRPVVGELAKVAHEGNIDPKAFNGLVAKYYEIQDQQRQLQVDADKGFHNDSIAALGGEWGNEFKTNVNVVNGFVGKFFPEDMAGDLLVARTPDGRMLGDNPAFIKALRALAQEVDPVGALVPHAGADSGKVAADRLAEIKTWMRAPQNSENWKKYWKDEKVRGEYRDLLSAQDKMKGRAA